MRLLRALLLPLVGLVGLSVFAAKPARAQYNAYGPFDPYSWNVYNEGPGIKFGHDGLVFHPGVAAELGYDSNVLLNNVPVDAGMLRLRLHLDLSTLPPQRVDSSYRPKIVFRAGAMFEYRQYFSRDPNVGTAQQFNGISDIDLAIKPFDPFSLRLYNNLVVTNDARNIEFASRETFAPRLYDRLGLLGTYRSGGGAGPLEVGLGEAVRFDYYIDQAFERNRSFANEALLYGQLKVLPQTTLKLELRSSYINYYGAGAGLPNAVPIRAIIAANSLLIPALGVTLFAGYGNSLQLGADQFTLVPGAPVNYNNFVGGAELRLRLLAQLRLSVGWARDFYDSIYATFLADDRLYLRYDHYIWRGLVAHLRFDSYFRQYGALLPAASLSYSGYSIGGVACSATSPCNRSDVILNLGAELNYRVLSWMELGVSYSLLDDITEFRFGTAAGGDEQPAAFIKHTVLGKIDIAY